MKIEGRRRDMVELWRGDGGGGGGGILVIIHDYKNKG